MRLLKLKFVGMNPSSPPAVSTRSGSDSGFTFFRHISKPTETHEKTLLTLVGFGCGQKLAAGPCCTQATLNNHSACFTSIVVIFVMWLVLVRWICDSLNPPLTQSTVWRAWHFVTTTCRHSKGLFLPAEECLMRPRNRICESCLWDKGNYSFFSSTICCLCCLSVVHAIQWAVLLVRMAFCSRTGQCIVGSRCSRCIHTHLRKDPCLLLTHSQKPHADDTKGQRLCCDLGSQTRTGCFCHDLCVSDDTPPFPPPAHYVGHCHCSCEARAHLPLMYTKET